MWTSLPARYTLCIYVPRVLQGDNMWIQTPLRVRYTLCVCDVSDREGCGYLIGRHMMDDSANFRGERLLFSLSVTPCIVGVSYMAGVCVDIDTHPVSYTLYLTGSALCVCQGSRPTRSRRSAILSSRRRSW
jgi:hypothetical protein